MNKESKKDEHLLDGKSFTFQYQNAEAANISFAAGKLTYLWTAGRMVGEPEKKYPYKSRKIDSEIYLINWHEADASNFVSVVYNFKAGTCTVSVISHYASDEPFTGMQAGVITHLRET